MSEITLLSNRPDFQQQTTTRNASSNNLIILPRRNPNLAKWNILFDKNITEWISFIPKLGLEVYPCYACRNMFGSKNSFLDHVNRRGMLLKYNCSYCTERDPMIFYNPCSFLLHTRQHYTLLGGQINLECLEISLLPYGLAGFLTNPDISVLYNVEDDNSVQISQSNSRFYSPVNQCMGNPIVNLFPNELLFYSADKLTKEITSLTLKQISSNIPHCQFTCGAAKLDMINASSLLPGESCIISIKEEAPDYFMGQNEVLVSQIESTKENTKMQTLKSIRFPKCPECHQTQRLTMGEHFLNTNLPFLHSLKCSMCSYIAPTKCSLKAHERIHNNIPPFVCPECGKDFPARRQLYEHMQDVCFHLTKQVRIRCSGKRCGKIFAQMGTFSSHFLLHVKVWLQCTLCCHISSDELAFLDHNSYHEVKDSPLKVFKCEACIDSEKVFPYHALQDHIRQHAVSKFLYVYICKRCHSYFRSTATYATHLLRCNRVVLPQVRPSLVTQPKLLTTTSSYYCSKCDTKITPHPFIGTSKICSKCDVNINLTLKNTKISLDRDHTFCPLCDQELTLNEIVEHAQYKCRYCNPTVVLEDCGHQQIYIKKEAVSPELNESRKKFKSSQETCDSREESLAHSELDLSTDFDEL